MRELEEVNCEIRRIVNLQFPVSNWIRNLEHGSPSTNLQEHDNIGECHGGFLYNATYAWLSYDCHLIIFNAKVGESISSWTFRGVVTSVSQFPAQSGEFPLLLVGIDNCASKLKDSFGLLCIFDCATSRVLRAIRLPCGIEQVCVVAGGAEWEEFNDKRPDNILSEMDGMACVALRNLHHIMIDLRRTIWDTHDSFIVRDEASPAEIDFPSMKQISDRERYQSIREKHAAYNLLDSRIEKHIGFNREDFESSPLLGENLTTVMISSVKIGCLISGCLGRVIIWQNDGSIGWISTPIDENMTVTHLALLEPTDDPRPFYYLWVVFQDELSKAPPILRMYAMLFERKYCDREINLYFNLEDDPSLKFETELNEGDKIVDLRTVERESNPEQTELVGRRGDDNLLLIATNDRVYLFDLNQWYKEQMPHTIGECQNPNSILATYRTRSDAQNGEGDDRVISFAYIPHSLQEFSSNGPSPPEELFYPNSLSLEWMELSSTKLTFWMTRGIQTDLLREIATVGPAILIQPFETFHKCLSVGLVPFNSEFSFSSDQNAQREMLLSLCLEQRWSTFLIKCAIEWSDGSASYLYPTFLKWGIQRASTIKLIADRLCIPLFDQSGSSIGEADVKTLRFCSQQLECLSNVVGKLPCTAMDLTKQRRTLRRVSTYFQVLLWFYDVGLLPESQDLEEEEEEEGEEMEETVAKEAEVRQEQQRRKEKNTLPISLALRVPYPYEKLSRLYREKRAQLLQKKNSDNDEKEDLFIDELIMRECSILKAQWEREGSVATYGYYPPPSLQSLLRSYLTDCHQTEANEINCRHQITIYLLMDLTMLLQRLYPAVKQLIKYPSAFMMSPSLIKLTQAFWLLDHENYQEFLDTVTGQLVCDSDIKDWHHRLILRTLVRNNQHKLALIYLRVRKPPLFSMEEQGIAMSLSVEHGLVQSAFHRRPPCHYEQLLTSFFRACKKYDKLDEILHLVLDSEEEEVFVKFLEENRMEDLRLLYYLQRCRYTEVIGGYPNVQQYQSNLARDVQSTSFNMLGAYDTTLPDVTKRFSTNVATTNSDADLKIRYSRPMSHCKSHDRLRSIYETVITKARETYQRGDKCQIPFVSAPCTSLRLNNCSVNVNCVSFPALMRKSRGKRTVDQIYEENEEDADDIMSDGVKRQKLLEGNVVSPSRQISRESELMETFETPLVKRKSIFMNSKDLETPQSILKIKGRLVGSLTESPIATVQTKETDDRSEKERKVNRQIRFNISQSKKALVYEEEEQKKQKEEKETETDEEEEEDEKKEEEQKQKQEQEEEKAEQNDNEIDIPPNSNEASNNAFFSPNANSKLAYCESAVLSDNSVTSNKIYCYARPRPSLRRSALQSSVQMSEKEFCARKTSSFSATSSTSEGMNKQSFISGTPKRRSSLLSTSIYSTTILSSDSSVDISYPRSGRTSPSQWKLSMERDGNDRLAISSTPLTKIIIPQMSINEKRTMEVDDLNTVYKIEEDLNVLNESKISTVPVERSGCSDKSDHAKQEANLETESHRARQNKYNNGRIAREANSNLREYEMPVLFSESEKVAESGPTVSHEVDEEIIRDVCEDNNSDEYETFESLPCDMQMQLDSQVPASNLFLETWSFEYGTEGRSTTKPNGLRNSMRAIDDVDLTDDESVNSRATTPAVPDADNNKVKTHSMPIVHSEHTLFYGDMPNITDDESDSSIRETEEPKAKNGYSNLQKHCITQSVQVEKNGEKNRVDKLGRKQSVSKKSLAKTLPRSDVADDKASNKICYVKLYKIDDSKIEETVSKETSERKLSGVQCFSEEKSERNRVETTDISSVRMTRSRTASSTGNNIADTWVRQAELGKITRSQRASSMTKDSLSQDTGGASSPHDWLQSVDLTTRDSPSLSTSGVDAEKALPPQSREFEKLSRSRRASSASKEMRMDSPLKKLRGRRASSLVKDVLMGSMPRDENLEWQLGTDSDVQQLVRRGRRCTSVTKEMLQVETKDSDSESVKDQLMRRSTRLASFARKELETDSASVKAEGNFAERRSESATSLARLTSDDEEVENKRFLRRARKSSVSSDTTDVTANRSLRLSTRDLDKEGRSKQSVIKMTRKRGNSVPKEMMTQSVIGREGGSQQRRSSSVVKEIISEVAEEESPEEDARTESSGRRVKATVGRLTTSARVRSTSVLSIPEELEEILSSPLRETRSTRKKAVQSNVRERRASSVDVIHDMTEMKRRVRNVDASIAPVSPIAEELVESEDRVKLERDEKPDGETVQSVVQTSKKRAMSLAIIEETKKNTVTKPRRGRSARKISVSQETSNLFSSLPEKRKRGRPRKTSVSQESSNLFSFSLPEKTDDVPLNEKDIGEVPKYVFSPPQTRSKNISLNQHQK
ncbi:protein ELYS isoform X2 [Monomorium pharaonis]|uniref:protein ELYS isoform X2 n=1 Tax=Monomorium pharaonis TaxID=307658 RepID=UPI00063F25D7|nr:protein ELYS isoform X2 [Monomorium pharaonis]